jgi:TolB-like protein/Flp pilus assembly protein TadD
LTDPAWQREAILTALERLLAWPEIARSPQLGRFLDYIVQRTLEGNEASIKAYSIAVDVFGRAADFDPQADPIVRVQARRLRALLDDYYRGPGLGEATQIHLPVGRYVPEFAATTEPVAAEAPTEPPPPARPGWPGSWNFSASWFALAVIALGLAMTAYAMTAWRPQTGEDGAIGAMQRPTIAIVEFQNLATAMASPPQVAGLAIELVTDLEQFGNIAVRYGGGGEANAAVPDLPPSDYVLTGIVRPDGEVVQYSAILTDSVTSTVVWNQTLSVPVQAALEPGLLDRVSKSLSLVLGSPRGPLHVTARQLLASSAPLDGRFNAYLCRVLFDLYRETGGGAEAARASACYASLPESDRNSARVLAAMASLLVERNEGDGTPAERLQRATEDLQKAIGLDPVSGFVWEQQARLHEGQGDFVTARADFSSAVQLNGASVDALAAYARLLAFGGNLAEAEAMARDAAEHSPDPPPWYQGVPALLALRDGDLAAAIADAELYAKADRELGPILAIMAAQRAGDSDVVNRYLPQVLDVAAFRTEGVLPRLRHRIGDVVLMDTIRAALVTAGVPPAALTGPF